MRRWHRICAALTAILLTYVTFLGAATQLADMRALTGHVAETDPDMLMMRQHIDGPPNYSVVSAPDYTAPVLPDDLDVGAAIARAIALGRAVAPGTDLQLAELRMIGNKLVGHVQLGPRHLIFDLSNGTALPSSMLPPPPPANNFPSTRSWLKSLHRFSYLGRAGTGLDALAAIAFFVLILTGLAQYTQLYKARVRRHRILPFWRGGDWWRLFHRWISVGATIFILWITVSGFALAIDDFASFVLSPVDVPQTSPNPFDGNLASPLRDADILRMTRVTISSFHRVMPKTRMKVFRLRYFAHYPQGVVVAADTATTQLVFNATTGTRMSMSEKGYPDLGFPFGWEWHQRLKRIHRGDIFGMPGRWMDTLGASAMLYLLVSGTAMYWQLWSRRRKGGRAEVIW